jgi:hypothetical protein
VVKRAPHREQVVAGQHPRQQACGGAGIAHVQHVVRLGQSADATPGHTPNAAGLLHIRAQSPHRGGGTEHVLAFQQAIDPGLADGERGEHQGAVANGFVAGHADAARQGCGRTLGAQGVLGHHQAGAISSAGPVWIALGLTGTR